nr:MAG: hypothetical protein [Bacteriophage sp.]
MKRRKKFGILDIERDKTGLGDYAFYTIIEVMEEKD